MKSIKCRTALNRLKLFAALLIVTTSNAIAGQLFRAPLPEEYAINFWNFNDPAWLSAYGDPPLAATNVTSAPDFQGSSLLVDSTNAAFLNLPVVDWDGYSNLEMREGSVSLWLNPGWSSGSGPSVWGRLLDVGSFATNATGWFSLFVDAGGTNLYFAGQSNGLSAVYLSAPMSLASNTWYNIVLTYSPTNSALYLNGQLLTNGSGVAYWPGPDALTNGFFVGSDNTGQAQIHGAIDDLWTYDFPLDAQTISNAYIPRSTWVPGSDSGSGLIAGSFSGSFSSMTVTEPGVGIMALDYTTSTGTNNLWLEILPLGTNVYNSDTNSATLILHGTTNDNASLYELLSEPALNGSSWTVQQTFLGSPGQDWTPLTISMTNSTTLYLCAVVANYDSDNDGLPDWWEFQYGLDPNNADTGNTGIPDGLKSDGIGDGYTYLQKYQMGVAPNVWATPPAPAGFTAVLNPTNGVVTLSWQSTLGAVSGYSLSRFDAATFSVTNMALGLTNSFVDPNYPAVDPTTAPFYLFPSYYYISAVYSNAESSAVAYAYPVPYNTSPVAADVVFASSGNPVLAVWQVPPDVTQLRVTAVTNDQITGDSYAVRTFTVPVSSITNGLYTLSNTIINPYGISWPVEGLTADGHVRVGGDVSGTMSHFWDGRAALQQNAAFVLRAGGLTNPFTYYAPYGGGINLGQPPGYAYVGYYNHTYNESGLSWAEPFDENYRYLNFALPNSTNFAFLGSLTTGVSGSGFGGFDLGSPHTFNFMPPTTTNSIPLVLGTNQATWLVPYEDPTEVGIQTIGGTNYYLPTGITNYYGLALLSVTLAYPGIPEQFTNLVAGHSTAITGGLVDYFYANYDQPVFQTVGYYFVSMGQPLPGSPIFHRPIPRHRFTPRSVSRASSRHLQSKRRSMATRPSSFMSSNTSTRRSKRIQTAIPRPPKPASFHLTERSLQQKSGRLY